MNSIKIKVDRNDIFNYVVGNSFYDAIEKCIDPTRYEIFDHAIYDHKSKKQIDQSEEYKNYCTQVSLLRQKAKEMNRNEIQRLCEELEEIAPKEIFV